MKNLKLAILMIVLLGSGALFGFYFTMSVSIMPGLDQTEPYAAIVANQNIGRATQQSLFFVALLGTPISLVITTVVFWKASKVRNWLLLSLAGWITTIIVTFTLNVPLNQVLDGLAITQGQDNLAELWAAYGVDWQKWNWLRVSASGFSLCSLAIAIKASSEPAKADIGNQRSIQQFGLRVGI